MSTPRLPERVAHGTDQKLTLIIGPAGAGKTTLLAAWAAGRADDDLPLAWLSLDAGDNDSYRFWDSFITALSSIAPGWRGQETVASAEDALVADLRTLEEGRLGSASLGSPARRSSGSRRSKRRPTPFRHRYP